MRHMNPYGAPHKTFFTFSVPKFIVLAAIYLAPYLLAMYLGEQFSAITNAFVYINSIATMIGANYFANSALTIVFKILDIFVVYFIVCVIFLLFKRREHNYYRRH